MTRLYAEMEKRMEVSPYLTSLPVVSLDFIETLRIVGVEIYETTSFYILMYEYHHLSLLGFRVSLTFKLDKHRYKGSLNLS